MMMDSVDSLRHVAMPARDRPLRRASRRTGGRVRRTRRNCRARRCPPPREGATPPSSPCWRSTAGPTTRCATSTLTSAMIVMERSIADRARSPRHQRSHHHAAARSGIRILAGDPAGEADPGDLCRHGGADPARAYRQGSSAEVDEAIRLQPALEAFLGQRKRTERQDPRRLCGLARILEEAGVRADFANECELMNVRLPRIIVFGNGFSTSWG